MIRNFNENAKLNSINYNLNICYINLIFQNHHFLPTPDTVKIGKLRTKTKLASETTSRLVAMMQRNNDIAINASIT